MNDNQSQGEAAPNKKKTLFDGIEGFKEKPVIFQKTNQGATRQSKPKRSKVKADYTYPFFHNGVQINVPSFKQTIEVPDGGIEIAKALSGQLYIKTKRQITFEEITNRRTVFFTRWKPIDQRILRQISIHIQVSMFYSWQQGDVRYHEFWREGQLYED